MRFATWTAVVIAAATLCACRPGEGTDAPPAYPPPPGPHLKLDIDAPKDTAYRMLCSIRSYRSGPGQYANRYGVDTKGPYHDTILSPNADCTAELLSGSGPVTITLSKPGATQTATLATPGPAGKVKLLVF